MRKSRNLFEIYQKDTRGNTRDDARGYKNNEDCLKRNFRKKFRELTDNFTGGKIQSLIQLGDLETLEKEVELVMKKSDSLAEKCINTEDVEFIHHGTNDLEVSSVLRKW